MIPWHAITFSRIFDNGWVKVKASATVCGEYAEVCEEIREVPKGTAFFAVEWAPMMRQAAARLREKLYAAEFGDLETHELDWQKVSSKNFYSYLAERLGVPRKQAKKEFLEWYFQQEPASPAVSTHAEGSAGVET